MSLANKHVVTHKQRLDSLFDKSKDFAEDTELLGNWARYLCVLVSGFVEESIRQLILEYARNKSAPEIQHFVGKNISSFTNAKMSKILDLIEEFSDDLRRALEDVITEEHKAAVDSVVANRHQIAHGRNTGISFAVIKGYYSHTITMIERVEEVLTP